VHCFSTICLWLWRNSARCVHHVHVWPVANLFPSDLCGRPVPGAMNVPIDSLSRDAAQQLVLAGPTRLQSSMPPDMEESGPASEGYRHAGGGSGGGVVVVVVDSGDHRALQACVRLQRVFLLPLVLQLGKDATAEWVASSSTSK
jgi:hypothetical protein